MKATPLRASGNVRLQMKQTRMRSRNAETTTELTLSILRTPHRTVRPAIEMAPKWHRMGQDEF